MTTVPMHCTVQPTGTLPVKLPDGTMVHLHAVDTNSTRAKRIRALRNEIGWLVLDLGEIAPELKQDLPGAQARDVPALVSRALRRACPTSAVFSALARAASDETLTCLANGHRAPRRQEATC